MRGLRKRGYRSGDSSVGPQIRALERAVTEDIAVSAKGWLQTLSPVLPLEERIGYFFQDPALKRQVFSRRDQKEGKWSKGSLQFFGFMALQMFMADILLARYPKVHEQSVYQRWLDLTANRGLHAKIAEFFALNTDIITVDREAVRTDISLNAGTESFFADILNSLVGAVFMDGGLAPTKRLVARFLDSTIEQNMLLEWNYKLVFLGESQRLFKKTPEYNLRKRTNKAERIYLVQVTVDGRVWGEGRSLRQEEAVQLAAKDGLSKIKALDLHFPLETTEAMAKMKVPGINQLNRMPLKSYFEYYMKLKWLGHTVLNMILADMLVRQDPKMSRSRLKQKQESIMDFFRANVTNRDLQLWTSRRSRPRESTEIFGQVKYVLGLHYLRGGYESATHLVTRMLEELTRKADLAGGLEAF